ncbi:hypothetical protein Agub_g2089 [Astrephomene gubernaculifera]|uniref:Uncharacterized protein n=1 Tax=Astrephomene gubernaculifera TaxID=47775 RepID=A0AAD3HI44_9CHLO|nr:hypothetical protein Agub_g2089 [Astrephomene gubernaculifera]
MHLLRGGQRAYARLGPRGGGGLGRYEHLEQHQLNDSRAWSVLGGNTEAVCPWRQQNGAPPPFGNRSLSSLTSAVSCSPLLFAIEDLNPDMSSGPSMRAFKRVVCVPFQPSVKATGRAGLEYKVKQLLAEPASRCGPADVQSLFDLLSQNGFHVVTMQPAEPQRHALLVTRSNRAPFLVVTSEETGEVVIIDTALREHLAVAPSTPAYERALEANVPTLFIGTHTRLAHLVSSMAAAISLNFTSQGVDVPPWRRLPALLCRWSVVEEHARRLRQSGQHGGQRQQHEEQQLAAPAVVSPAGLQGPAAAAATLQAGLSLNAVGSAAAARPAPVECRIHGGQRSAVADGAQPELLGVEQHDAPHLPRRVVLGFVVGAGADNLSQLKAREGWSASKPGGLALMCRQLSSSTAAGSTEGDEVLTTSHDT